MICVRSPSLSILHFSMCRIGVVIRSGSHFSEKKCGFGYTKTFCECGNFTKWFQQEKIWRQLRGFVLIFQSEITWFQNFFQFYLKIKKKNKYLKSKPILKLLNLKQFFFFTLFRIAKRTKNLIIHTALIAIVASQHCGDKMLGFHHRKDASYIQFF